MTKLINLLLNKKLFIFLLISLYFTSSVYADSRNFSFKINNTKINVSTPDGFYESSNIYPERLDYVRTIYPDYLQVQALLAPKGIPDNERIARYVLLVTNKNADNQKITQEFFNDLREKSREQQFTLMNDYKDLIEDALEDGTSKLLKKYDVEFVANIGETVPLGVFFDNKKAISINMITNPNVVSNGVTYSPLQLASLSMVFIKNRIINVYIYSDYESENDIVWIEGITKELINLLINNN